MIKSVCNKFLYGVVLFLVALSAFACKEEKYFGVEHYFDMKMNDTSFRTQVALYPEELAKGLMFRESLGEMDSMIFIYEEARRVSFWMKNTLIPLDIGFFDKDGALLEVKSMYPRDLTSVPSTSDKVVYCLEVNPKFFQKNNIKVGDKLDMQLLHKAIKSRTKND